MRRFTSSTPYWITARFISECSRCHCKVTKGEYVPDGVTVKVWELYRKSPVKNGMNSSAYFDQATFRRIHPKV